MDLEGRGERDDGFWYLLLLQGGRQTLDSWVSYVTRYPGVVRPQSDGFASPLLHPQQSKPNLCDI